MFCQEPVEAGCCLTFDQHCQHKGTVEYHHILVAGVSHVKKCELAGEKYIDWRLKLDMKKPNDGGDVMTTLASEMQNYDPEIHEEYLMHVCDRPWSGRHQAAAASHILSSQSQSYLHD